MSIVKYKLSVLEVMILSDKLGLYNKDNKLRKIDYFTLNSLSMDGAKFLDTIPHISKLHTNYIPYSQLLEDLDDFSMLHLLSEH
jgi:hypothetical protein